MKDWVIQQAGQLHAEYFAVGAQAGALAGAGGVAARLATLAQELLAPSNTATDDYALLVELAGMFEESSAGASAFELTTSNLVPR